MFQARIPLKITMHHFQRHSQLVRPSVPAPKQWGLGMVKAAVSDFKKPALTVSNKKNQ